MKVFGPAEIEQAIDLNTNFQDIINSQRAAFIDFSEGKYTVPLPMHFIFPESGSDSHIKGAYKKASKHLVIKIANGSPEGGDGLILVFESDTGKPKALLKDKGQLTSLRTAIAGILVSELLPWQIKNIGIIGSGNLAKMLHNVVRLKYPQKNIMFYARNPAKLQNITRNIASSVQELQEQCDVIFTATSSENTFIKNIAQGSYQAIIALGSDDEHKKELSPEIFGKSDLVIVDSKLQSIKFGDVAKAIDSKIISQDFTVELGKILKSGVPASVKTIIADFSGIAAQDFSLVDYLLTRLDNPVKQENVVPC